MTSARAHLFRLLVFDLDGTLVDSQQGIVRAMSAAFLEVGLEAPQEAAVRRVIGLGLEPAIERLVARPLPGAMIVQLAEAYRRIYLRQRRHPEFEEALFPGAREALDALDEPEVFLGIATGKGRRGLQATLAHHGLEKRFATLQTADDGPSKPDPEILRRAMAEVAVGPEETVVIGDTHYDMEMARRAGTRAVGVAWGYHGEGDLVAAGAGCIAESFAALPACLVRLSREAAG